MKRGKEDEKVMGPMFPRLHVNEREKGGPRAPPRNKMALYEQLSIPSQRFNPVLNPNHNTSSAASSTQGSGKKRPMFSPLHLPRSTPLADNSNAISSECNTASVSPQKRLDEEDFAVPVFVLPENDQNNKNSDIMDRANASLSRPAQINLSSRNQSTFNKERKLSRTRISNVRQKDQCQIQKLQCPPEDQEDREHPTNDMDGSLSSNDALHHEVIDVSQMQSVHNVTSNREYHKDKTGIRNMDECDDGSDTSMVDSVSGVYITPDEVVGVIGQKHFWKARRAIVNQQRVFAVQVFELHRLIKVQKLFAGSPDLIHEDTSFVGKTLKTSIPKQISLEFIVKPSANIENCKENHLNNPSQKTEGSAETAVGGSSLSSSQNVSHHHPSNGIPFSPNPQSTPETTDPGSSPWYFNQPTGHHWLVPVVSPTEGLVYKPYVGPGHTGSNPTMSNFSNPHGMPNSHPYRIPNSHPYGMLNYHPFFQGMGVPPSFPSMTHQCYFPPYGIPPMGPAISGSVVNQANHFMGTSFIGQQQNSYSGPAQKNDSKPNTPNFVERENDKESELQVSTASSPGEGSNGLKLFPTSPSDGMATENLTRAIKVVPHNAVSANESAFRIFQSIQKEREQYESV